MSSPMTAGALNARAGRDSGEVYHFLIPDWIGGPDDLQRAFNTAESLLNDRWTINPNPREDSLMQTFNEFVDLAHFAIEQAAEIAFQERNSLDEKPPAFFEFRIPAWWFTPDALLAAIAEAIRVMKTELEKKPFFKLAEDVGIMEDFEEAAAAALDGAK